MFCKEIIIICIEFVILHVGLLEELLNKEHFYIGTVSAVW